MRHNEDGQASWLFRGVQIVSKRVDPSRIIESKVFEEIKE